MKPKLLYLVTQAEFGGAQRYIFDLATRLKDDFEITVAAGETGRNRELLDRAEKAGIRTRELKHLKRAIIPLQDMLAFFELTRFFRRERFDLIHANSTKAGILGALAARIAGTKAKVLYTAHGWVFLEPLSAIRRNLYLAMEKIAARFRDATIILSNRERDIALRFRLGTSETLHVIPHGIEIPAGYFLSKAEAQKRLADTTGKRKAESGKPQDELVIGTIANLYPTKGLDVLIRAFGETTFPEPARLVIIGEGPERPNLERLIIELGQNDRAMLAGAIPDAARLLHAFDIFVLPSRKEGLPYALLEAMAAGLPMVATAIGGVPEIIEHQKNGLLVPPDDAAALGQTLRTLSENDSLRARIGEAARRTFENACRIEQMLSATRAVYASLLSPCK